MNDHWIIFLELQQSSRNGRYAHPLASRATSCHFVLKMVEFAPKRFCCYFETSIGRVCGSACCLDTFGTTWAMLLFQDNNSAPLVSSTYANVHSWDNKHSNWQSSPCFDHLSFCMQSFLFNSFLIWRLPLQWHHHPNLNVLKSIIIFSFLLHVLISLHILFVSYAISVSRAHFLCVMHLFRH